MCLLSRPCLHCYSFSTAVLFFFSVQSVCKSDVRDTGYHCWYCLDWSGHIAYLEIVDFNKRCAGIQELPERITKRQMAGGELAL